MVRIILDGSTYSGKSTTMGYIQSYLDGLRETVNIVPEIATIVKNLGYSIDKNSTVDTQPKIFELQKQFEKVSSENGKLHLICDRGALSALPYVKFADIPVEEKDKISQEITDYAKTNIYHYCIYMEPLNTKKLSEKNRKRQWQMMLDRETRKVYEEWFTRDVNLFYIPVFNPDAVTKEEVKEAKTIRNEYVLKLIEKLLNK